MLFCCTVFLFVCGCVCVCVCVCVIYCDFLLIISDVKMKIKALDLVSSGKDEKKNGGLYSPVWVSPTVRGIQPVFNFKIIHPYPHCRTPPSALTKNLSQDDWPPRSHPLTPFFGLLSPNDPLFEFTTNFRQSQTRHQKQDF